MKERACLIAQQGSMAAQWYSSAAAQLHGDAVAWQYGSTAVCGTAAGGTAEACTNI